MVVWMAKCFDGEVADMIQSDPRLETRLVSRLELADQETFQ